MPHRKLQLRLERCRALASGGATVGERAAARRAARRIEDRLARLGAEERGPPPALDPTLRPCEEARVPSTAALKRAVQTWMAGDCTAEDLARSARRLVDRVVLPDRPADDPLSIRVEVVMLLTTLPGGPVTVQDAPALCRFLDTPPERTRQGWDAWFQHLRGERGCRLAAG